MGAVAGPAAAASTSATSTSTSTTSIPSSPLRSQRPQKQTTQLSEAKTAAAVVSIPTSQHTSTRPVAVLAPTVASESKGNEYGDDDHSSLGDDNLSDDDDVDNGGRESDDFDPLDDLDVDDDFDNDGGELQDLRKGHGTLIRNPQEVRGVGRSDDHHHDLSKSNGRPLSPTSAIAAAFRKLQAKIRRLERVKNEHSLCVDRLSRVEAKSAEALSASDRRATSAEASLQSLQKSSSSSLALLEQQMGARIRELEVALISSKKEVAEGNALLAAARDVFESQARGEVATARRAWDEGFAAAEKKAAEESAYTRSQHAKLLSSKEAECEKERMSAATLRNEVAMMRGEIAAMKAKGSSSVASLSGGCARCKDFDLPIVGSSSTTTSGISEQRGPWYSVAEVKNAISNAAGVKLVVLAPTVKVSVAGAEDRGEGGGGGGGGGEIATLRASMQSEEVFNALERDILPRFAATFALPGLHSRSGSGVTSSSSSSGGGGGGEEVSWRKGPEKDKDLEPWLKRLMRSLEESVTEKLRSSGGLKVVSGEASLA